MCKIYLQDFGVVVVAVVAILLTDFIQLQITSNGNKTESCSKRDRSLVRFERNLIVNP